MSLDQVQIEGTLIDVVLIVFTIPLLRLLMLFVQIHSSHYSPSNAGE